jgi:UTP--glucose-1-phosphate uridylyltransferase
MIDAYAGTGGNLVAVIEAPREQTRHCGVLDVLEDPGELVRAKGVVEKPEPAVAPSTLTIIGRYIIQPEIFDYRGVLKPGSGNEIQKPEPAVAPSTLTIITATSSSPRSSTIWAC